MTFLWSFVLKLSSSVLLDELTFTNLMFCAWQAVQSIVFSETDGAKSFLHTKAYYHSHPVPGFHRILGQGGGVKTASEEQASWLGCVPVLELPVQTWAVCLWASLRDVEKKKMWQLATYWLSFFHCFLPCLSYPKPQASSPRCLSDAFRHLFYTPPPLSLCASCPDPWRNRPLSTKPNLPVTTCNTYIHTPSMLFLLQLTTELT